MEHHGSHSSSIESSAKGEWQWQRSQARHLQSLQCESASEALQNGSHFSTSESHTPIGASEWQALLAPPAATPPTAAPPPTMEDEPTVVVSSPTDAAALAAALQKPQCLHLHRPQCELAYSASQKVSQSSTSASPGAAGVHTLPCLQNWQSRHLHCWQCTSAYSAEHQP
jgi:hypothetical protein